MTVLYSDDGQEEEEEEEEEEERKRDPTASQFDETTRERERQ